jgi:mono/diheme cytochrome c family protein
MSIDLRRHLPSAAFVLSVLLVTAGFAGIYIYIGAYNIAADAPHSRFVYSTLDALRERAIAAHSRDITPPADLNDPKRIAAGAGLYNEMCTGCHLGPGMEKSEMSQGLYPPAPELTAGNKHTPEQMFWIIKHGVKLTAMPAWGKTHDDRLIWDMVGLIRQLPKMSPDQYQAAVTRAPASHDEMMEEVSGRDEEHNIAAEPHIHPAGRAHHHHD